jgi:Mn-dependent DtxR family transcriptional regulator
MFRNLRNRIIEENVVCSKYLSNHISYIIKEFTSESRIEKLKSDQVVELLEAFINLSCVCDFYEDALDHLISLKSSHME